MAIIPADVTRMLRGTAGWLSAALPQFDPHRPSREVYSNFAPAKAFAELSFFCMVARRRAKGKEEPDFEAMRTFIREVVSRPRFIEGAKDPKKFLLHLNIHVAAETLGLKSPESRDVLQRLLANGYVTSRDNKNPFRLMDLRYTLDRGGFRHALPSVEQLYSRTLLAKHVPLTSICNGEAYAITHTLFYLTDYGREAPAGFSRGDLARWRWLVENLLGMSVLAGNWDLTSELLLCCRLLRWYPRVVYDASWRALSRAQQPDGSFEGPLWSMDYASNLDGPSRKTYDIQMNYHTTLVAGLACLLA